MENLNHFTCKCYKNCVAIISSFLSFCRWNANYSLSYHFLMRKNICVCFLHRNVLFLCWKSTQFYGKSWYDVMPLSKMLMSYPKNAFFLYIDDRDKNEGFERNFFLFFLKVFESSFVHNSSTARKLFLSIMLSYKAQ